MEVGESSSQNSDEDDPIVKEIPIYLSKRLEDQLYVFQYPLRPKKSKTEVSIEKAFFKPDNMEVMLEQRVNIHSSSFNYAKAEDLAHEIDSNRDKKIYKEPFFESNLVDKINLTSSKVITDVDKYVAGIFNGKEYHITPLKGYLQLRPSLDFLDRAVKKKKDGKDTNAESDDEEEAGPSSAQAVTVKFARNETEKSIKARENSYRTLKHKRDTEKWTECTWHNKNSTLSEVARQKLYSEVHDNVGQALNIKPEEYIRLLVPEDQEQSIIKPSLPSNVVSLHALRALPLSEQCRLLLKDAKIIQFQQLMMLLAGCEGLTSESLLKSIMQVGSLVRGNWIVNSEILYPPKSFSAVSGVPADVMCRSRDYVLYLFTKNQYVDRRKVSSIIRIPSEEVKEIFTGIAKLKHNKGWELILSNDVDFLSKNPDVALKQQTLWDERWQELNDVFKEAPIKEKRQRRKSKSISEEPRVKKEYMSSDTDSGTEKKSPIAARKNKNKIPNDVHIKV